MSNLEIFTPHVVRLVKSRKLRCAGYVTLIVEGSVVHWVLVERHEGKRSLGRPRHRLEDNIKMVLREVGGCGNST